MVTEVLNKNSDRARYEQVSIISSLYMLFDYIEYLNTSIFWWVRPFFPSISFSLSLSFFHMISMHDNTRHGIW